jgi:excisionase family DNA binding protein
MERCSTPVLPRGGLATSIAATKLSLNGAVVFENLVTREQLAEMLVLSPSFISKLMSEGRLPYIKIGKSVRFRVSEVMTWLQKRSRP